MSSTTQPAEELKVRKPLDIGDEAPDFTLRDTDGQAINLSDFRGQKNVLLVFYPFAFSGTCTKEFCQIRDENTDLVSQNLEVFGVSTDPVHTLRAWKKAENYVNRFLSDFWPHGAVSKVYGAFDEKIGADVRCTFLIDKEGIIRFVERNALENIAEARDQDAWKRAVAALP